MDAEQRIVTKIPLTELWNASGPVEASRGPDLHAADIKDLLRAGLAAFVVADVGQPLHWVPKQDCFAFWKDEVAPQLADGDAFRLDDYPAESCYVASRWDTVLGVVIVLARHH